MVESAHSSQTFTPTKLTLGFRRLIDAELVELLDGLGSTLRRGIDDERRPCEFLIARVCRVRRQNALVLPGLHSNLDITHRRDTQRYHDTTKP